MRKHQSNLGLEYFAVFEALIDHAKLFASGSFPRAFHADETIDPPCRADMLAKENEADAGHYCRRGIIQET